MTSPFAIRRASSSDLNALPDIERAASRLFPASRIPDVDDTMSLQELEKACDAGLLYLASREDEIVGFAMATVHGRSLHIDVMAVSPDHGRRGAGTKLIRTMSELARGRGLRIVTLTTFRDLPWNAPFYEKVGFRVMNDGELTPMLRETLRYEADLGMTDRVAMGYALGD